MDDVSLSTSSRVSTNSSANSSSILVSDVDTALISFVNLYSSSSAKSSSNNNNNNNNNRDENRSHRAIHQIRLPALVHNYNCVEAAAAQQKCNVIVVVKADGYGHGAIPTAVHLAEKGADAFAVATLEEAILLRKALDASAKRKPTAATAAAASLSSSRAPIVSVDLKTMFQPQTQRIASHIETNPSTLPLPAVYMSLPSTSIPPIPVSRRPANIRILVLGPPVGYPNCFHDYYHYCIECMVSGPEVAAALLQWVANPLDHKRRQVERVAQETKQLLGDSDHDDDDTTTIHGISPHRNAATLSGNTGKDLANEYKRFLLAQQKATQLKTIAPTITKSNGTIPNDTGTGNISSSTTVTPTPNTSKTSGVSEFAGIEAAARCSRNREKAAKCQVWIEDSVSDQSTMATNQTSSTTATASSTTTTAANRRRLKWHALVDTGMGRLGFKTEYPSSSSERRDTVEILQELIHAELHDGSPIEFYGMCTHMADANPTSTYTHDQIGKFKSLLKRVRDAGISVPTVSTDNSAALLTKSLTHFDPNVLLTQPDFNTRGYVRIGGAIYGQRQAFAQLKSVSTLLATVRHIAILKENESVGYDRAYIAPCDTRIATLAIGFADGYPRELGNGRGHVAIRSRLYPSAGNICMDMMMVQLGPADEESDVRVGDVAVLWGGDDGVPLKDVAAALGTTQSALTCGLNKARVVREYIL